jgi:hypothetical protein
MSPIDVSGAKIDLALEIKPIAKHLKCALSAIKGSGYVVAPKIRHLIASNSLKAFEDIYPHDVIRRSPSPNGSSPLSK